MATATGVKRPQQPANDLERKVMILKDVNAGVSRQEITKKYNVKRSTLSDYVKNQAKIFEAFDSGKFTGKRKRLRTAAHPKLEDALLRWITEMRNGQLPLSGPLICQQAERFGINPQQYWVHELMVAQDEELEGIQTSVGTLKSMSKHIGSELDEQSVMLDDLGHDMDNTESKIDGALKKMAKVLHMSNDRRQWMAIGALSGVMVVVVALFFLL
ncbi:hypothetical protein HPB50_007193 [Hyalomma asiaticum]|uniref:Uncharacterized protein n=1 Tax=Hyalomma asiaticum TaxID=266040 RepID=A0ACB7TG31_HYAAI|nr:hypothetical protein HPB50_007193 [Hyalomma asiaticum]